MPGAEARLVGHWHDWAGDSQEPIDEDPTSHGTALVALLLRVAIHAEIFVGRVVKDKNGLYHAEKSISEVINPSRIGALHQLRVCYRQFTTPRWSGMLTL
jgi:hypothetical protein